MNKRIEQLAKQNGFIHDHMSVGERNDALIKFEKFAELIVRECMKVCQLTSIREDDGQTFVYSDAIQEHFRS